MFLKTGKFTRDPLYLDDLYIHYVYNISYKLLKVVLRITFIPTIRWIRQNKDII